MKSKIILILLIVVLAISSMTGCSTKSVSAPDTKSGTYDEMVNYLISEGFIKKDTTPIDINKTKGYLTDNTNGQWTDLVVADEAKDYDGLYLFYWNPSNESGLYKDVYSNIAVNGNVIVLGGGAAVLQLSNLNGNFGIAFSNDYKNSDEVIAKFKALTSK